MTETENAKAKVLITGATGFIGRRLVDALAAEGIPVRCLVRRLDVAFPPQVEVAQGDMLQRNSLLAPLRGIETAYYLVHAMGGERAGFEQRDR
ncbi:NAD(P)H-binding protein [Geomonas paludis]|nr:NAD-dependent epimerase/dehydratase family protein [Geomonas paludis]UPU35688.1 NAD(P)H-binding protein [Geomonas paludis]